MLPSILYELQQILQTFCIYKALLWSFLVNYSICSHISLFPYQLSLLYTIFSPHKRNNCCHLRSLVYPLSPADAGTCFCFIECATQTNSFSSLTLHLLLSLSLSAFISSFLSVCLPTDISIMKRKGSQSSSRSGSASLTHVVTFPGEINAPIVPFIISHFHLHLHLHFPPPQCPPARVVVVVR